MQIPRNQRASSASLDSERYAVDNYAHCKQRSPNLTDGGQVDGKAAWNEHKTDTQSKLWKQGSTQSRRWQPGRRQCAAFEMSTGRTNKAEA